LFCSASHFSPCEYISVSTDGESQAPSTTPPYSGKSHTLSNWKLLSGLGRGTQPIFEVVFNLKGHVIIVLVDMCLLVLCHPATICSWRGVHTLPKCKAKYFHVIPIKKDKRHWSEREPREASKFCL